MDNDDRFYMNKALLLAKKGLGLTSPNPAVGAVVVKEKEIVGSGYHRYAGGPHAELSAIRAAGAKAAGATLYVTLEPCNHYGRTPPCTAAILEAGISKVVVGMPDPNPNVKGGGIDHLRSKGIRVDVGILEDKCRLLNQAFIKHATRRIPLVALKAAMTLDGRIATRTGHSKWITNERSRRFGHQLRCWYDAVLVGVGTVLADDPRLTARLPKRRKCRQPVRVVLDTHLKTQTTRNIVQTAGEGPVIIACGQQADPDKFSALTDAGVALLPLPVAKMGVSLGALLAELGKRNITSVLVEGGARVHGSFLEEGLADEFYFFYAPKILGDSEGLPSIWGTPRELMSEARAVYDIRVRRFGQDVLLRGRFSENLY